MGALPKTREEAELKQTEECVRGQYEQYPYPPLPFFALPRRNQGQGLKYELGSRLAWKSEKSHTGIRILVAGAGTLEALVVAQMHPQASEVMAIDISSSSLRSLQRRITLYKTTRFYVRIPPIHLVCADLTEGIQAYGKFDYIIASNVLHHTSDPGRLLKILSEALLPDGLMRIVTYPKASRIWMRKTSKWLKFRGLDQNTASLLSKVKEQIFTLPKDHPIRSSFEIQPEIYQTAGLVDAFFHVCENPYSPLQWEKATQAAALVCVGETQQDTSRSTFLTEIVPELKSLNRWQQLQILDNLLELCANPVLWLKPSDDLQVSSFEEPYSQSGYLEKNLPTSLNFNIPSEFFWEMKQGLLEVQALLQESKVDLGTLIRRFHHQVGPRVHPQNQKQILPGLAASDYDIEEILEAQMPWDLLFWTTVQKKWGPHARLSSSNCSGRIPGFTLLAQAEWLQFHFGFLQKSIPVEIQIESPDLFS